MVNYGDRIDSENMNSDNPIAENTVLNIVKDKFRHDENVISVSHRYTALHVLGCCIFRYPLYSFNVCYRRIFAFINF